MSELEILDWEGLSPFYYEGLVKKTEINDGSCFFHCIADSFYRKYQLGQVNRKEFVKNLRKDLSKNLSVAVYEKLSRGQLKNFRIPGYSLLDFKKILDSNEYVDNRFNEYISNVIDKDIYIIDYEKKDVYITGSYNDVGGILYKNRDSIVIIWINGNHYDLAGVLEGKKLITLFQYNHPFIETIRQSMNKKSLNITDKIKGV